MLVILFRPFELFLSPFHKQGKGFDYFFWFQFNIRIMAESCTMPGLKVRCRLLKVRARCEIRSV